MSNAPVPQLIGTNTMKTEYLHPFEIAGLGESPFRYAGIRENVYSACPGHQQPGGTCDYCGQGIRYECIINSKDGKQFVVGMDCVAKLGRADNKLVDAVKRERLNMERAKRQAEREAKWAEHAAKYAAEMDRQREANGGLTDSEVAKEAEKAKRLEESKQWVTKNNWLLKVLDCEYPSEFIRGMIERLEAGTVAGMPPRAITILKDIYAKSHGRRGSKKYDAALDDFNARAGIDAE